MKFKDGTRAYMLHMVHNPRPCTIIKCIGEGKEVGSIGGRYYIQCDGWTWSVPEEHLVTRAEYEKNKTLKALDLGSNKNK
jgi:hypothetical protein